MPALSPTMVTGNLGEWQKKVGDEINPGDVLVGIETDKAQMDFECQEEGYLAKILLSSNHADVPVNTPLAVLCENKEDIPKFADYVVTSGSSASKVASTPIKADEPELAPTPATKSAETNDSEKSIDVAIRESQDRLFASPAARTLASEKNIQIDLVQGTGPNNRILKEDVQNYKAAPAVTITRTPSATPAAAAAASPPPPTGTAYKDTPLSGVRKVIANRLTESKSTIPHYYLTVEINADRLLKLREVLNKESNGKFKLSVNDFVIKASSLALRDVPEVNSSWQGTFIRQYTTADIAVAVATENGLITPIIRSVENKGLASIANTVKNLAEKGRQNKLAPHEYQGGTFTISNLGMYGIQHFTAIINPPHAAILAVGSVQDKLVLDVESEKGFRAQKVIQFTLSNDHRVVDGAVGAQFLQKFKAYLENPLNMLL